MKITEWDEYFPNFTPEEYLSPGGLVLFREKNIIPFDVGFLLRVERLRSQLNFCRKEGYIACDKEIYLRINTFEDNLRGFVTPVEWLFHRSKEDGQFYSFHLWCAADISSNIAPEVLAGYAKNMKFGGIIQYSWGVHLDGRKGEQYIKEAI